MSASPTIERAEAWAQLSILLQLVATDDYDELVKAEKAADERKPD